MSTKEKTIEKHFYNNTFIKYFTVILLTGIMLLFVIQWIVLNNSFNSFKIESQEKLTNLENVKTNLIEIKDVEEDSSNYIFKSADIEKINNNLNALATEIYSERNKAESLIDKDIDRLNLYMAVGIGFLAMLGVFVPISINILSNDDLKKKLDELQKKSDKLDETHEVLGKSISKITKDVEGIDKEKIDKAVENSKLIERLKEDSAEILPKLSVISLQIAIHRLFNQSSLTLSKSNENTIKLFKELFENIQDQLKLCQDDVKLNIAHSPTMKQTLKDFAELIDNESFKYTSYLTNRNIDEELLISKIIDLSESDETNQSERFKLVLETFDTFINEMEVDND
ncbi:MAG: hypothetical protein ACWA42_02245 [Lutibacter sp.]